MTKAAGVLGAALILAGMPSSLAVADPAPNYTNLQGAFRKVCNNLGRDPSAEPLVDACLFVVEVLKPLDPPIDTSLAETQEAILNAFLKATPGLQRNSSCEVCELAVDRLELILGMEDTPLFITRALGVACVEKVSDPAAFEQCRELVEPVLGLIEVILNEFPP